MTNLDISKYNKQENRKENDKNFTSLVNKDVTVKEIIISEWTGNLQISITINGKVIIFYQEKETVQFYETGNVLIEKPKQLRLSELKNKF